MKGSKVLVNEAAGMLRPVGLIQRHYLMYTVVSFLRCSVRRASGGEEE